MKIDLNKQIKGFSGKDYEGDGNHLGKVLAEGLAVSTKGHSIKLMEWARKFWNKETVEMDATDLQMLRGLVETAEVFNNLSKAQILQTLDDIDRKERDKDNKK